MYRNFAVPCKKLLWRSSQTRPENIPPITLTGVRIVHSSPAKFTILNVLLPRISSSSRHQHMLDDGVTASHLTQMADPNRDALSRTESQSVLKMRAKPPNIAPGSLSPTSVYPLANLGREGIYEPKNREGHWLLGMLIQSISCRDHTISF